MRRRFFGSFLQGVALVGALSIAGAAGAQQGARPGGADPDLTRYTQNIVRVEATAISGAPSTETLGANRAGTGVILDDRTVLTIGYLLLEAEQVDVVSTSGKRFPGTVAGYDHASGFGVIRTVVPLDGMPLEFGDSDAVSEKEKVLTIGQGEPEATEIFVLSRKPFTGSWEYMVDSAIFTFPPVNNWSGAALITASGKLIGLGSLMVNDAASGQRNVPGNMYVPTNLVRPILKDLLATGRRSGPVQPWLGMTTEVVRGNLMVTRLSKQGPAESAGIEVGDIIVGVGGEKFGDQSEFYKRVWKQGPAGTTVTLKVLHAGDVKEIPVKSADRSESLRRPSGI